jgi:hypothetical protein
MKGDFSRIRFTAEKNYTAVLQQQGRVALDADANEQTAIDAYLRDTTNLDVIGSCGGPAHDAGFAISIQNGKIRIGRGRYYIAGILVENDRDQNYADQRFLIPSGPSDPSSESALMTALKDGQQSVQFILQVWRRFVTELDDPCLVEPAIGQADTTARLQTVWRVLGVSSNSSPAVATTAPASDTEPSLNGAVFANSTEAGGCNTNPIERLSSCCQALYRLGVPVHSGKMAAKTNPAGDDCGCQPIPAAGYQGLENQLYRVEIHSGGDYASATFKWSRENGSVVAKVTGVNGAIVTVNSLGPDANLGFQVNQWVELIDDTNLYGDTPNQPGVLFQIAALGPNNLQVTLSAAPNVNPSLNARMRRWDQQGNSAQPSGIPLSSAPMTLEYGIEIDFSKDGNYVSGDYWTIPARASSGQIDWACGRNGDPFLPPDYFAIYQAPLACVEQSASSAAPPAGADPALLLRVEYRVQDCRITFPTLTAITCGNDGPCTIVPRPGAGWEQPLLALKAGANADICFPIGTFPLTQPLVLKGLGHLRMTGAGLGTQIVATGVSAALIFSNCAGVEISNLFASTDTAILRKRRSSTPSLGGTLSFADCGVVSIDGVGLKCGYGVVRTAACIMVENSYAIQTKAEIREKTLVTGTGEVRIRHCDLLVGRRQEGILLVRVQRAQIEDNTLTAYSPKPVTLFTRLQDRTLRASALRTFISGARYLKANPTTPSETIQPKSEAAPATTDSGAAPPPETTSGGAQSADGSSPQAESATPTKAVTKEVLAQPIPQRKLLTQVTAGGQSIQFLTHPLLKDFWQPYLDQNAPKTFSTNRDLLIFIKMAAKSFLMQPKLIRGNTALINVIAALDKADLQAMARAISVGGEGIQECRILNNSVRDAIQGITVGMSNHKQTPYTRKISTAVIIAGNQINVGLPPGAQFHAAQAIFVGNVESLLVENNFAAVIANVDHVWREGIRIWGQFGRRIIVRHSHLAGFYSGIWFAPVGAAPNADRPPLWLMADNMAENASSVVLAIGAHPVPTSVTNMWINNLS